MQYRIASAALAALAVSSVNAGLISRQNALVIQPGYIVTPTISFNFQNLGAEALAYQTLAQLRDDLSRTAALVVELNKAATTVAADKQAQAQAVVKQVQANADAIRAKLEELTAQLIARGNGGGGGGNGGGAPGAPAIPSVAARSLNTQVRTQLSLIGSYLEQLITPLLGQVKTESATAIATSFKQIATATDAFLAAAQTALANGNGASAALLQRIADARVTLNPTLVAGISPNVSV
ncbi:Periaxin [Colletotrichum sp. SAR 10_86]|nr:Periaxin [Colletotrichum sp. SAR 10_75]KAI8224396.1 Periaxin [Colletotrichum sp. SAR 10_86]